MDLVDRIIYKVCPFVAGGVFIGSVYWTAVTYGAVTVMQVPIIPIIRCGAFPICTQGIQLTSPEKSTAFLVFS